MPGVIAAGDRLTAAAGASMLRQGGNAVDAAVAAAFASFITEVGVVHLGGSGMAQIYLPGRNGRPGTSVTYDFFSAMPGLSLAAAPRRLDFEKVTIDFGPATQDFYLGRGSVAVPGNIAGLCRMAAEHGRLPLATLLEPAIRLAREGVALAPFQAETCALLSPLYTHTAEMRRIFAKDGRIIQPGGWLHIPELAQSLEGLASEGAEYARKGRLAQVLVADQAAQGGLLTHADLEQYEVLLSQPIRLPYRGLEILLPKPSSSGGVLIAFSLKLLSHFQIAELRHGSTRHLRLLFEVMAATGRARPIWDQAVQELPADQAIDYFLADSLVGTYVEQVQAAMVGAERQKVSPEPAPHPDTSHLSVIDGDGMAVSLTTTAGESAGYVVPGTGYIPNNILGEADLHPAGFHSRPAGERIHTMMTPTIVLQQGRVRLVLGSGGSIRIRSAILQVLSNFLDHGMTLSDAVNRSRVHLEGGALQCELGYDPREVEGLEALGYPVNRWDRRSIYFGGAHTVSQTEDGQLVAVGDNRRGGSIAEAR